MRYYPVHLAPWQVKLLFATCQSQLATMYLARIRCLLASPLTERQLPTMQLAKMSQSAAGALPVANVWHPTRSLQCFSVSIVAAAGKFSLFNKNGLNLCKALPPKESIRARNPARRKELARNTASYVDVISNFLASRSLYISLKSTSVINNLLYVHCNCIILAHYAFHVATAKRDKRGVN